MPLTETPPTSDNDSYPKTMVMGEDLQNRFHSSTSSLRGENRLKIVVKPSDLARIRNFVVSHAANREDLDAIRHLNESGDFERYALGLLADKDELSSGFMQIQVRQLIGEILQDSDAFVLDEEEQLTWPRTSFPNGIPQVDPETAKVSMAIIGDGPAGVMQARLRQVMGYKKTTLLGRTKRAQPKRGIWNHARVAGRGHNTFATVHMFGGTLSSDGERTGGEIRQFLDNASSELRRSDFREGLVTEVRFDQLRQQYMVRLEKDGRGEELAYDTICIATGNAKPKDLNAPGAPMTTNASAVHAPMKRWQEPLTEKTREEFRGRSPVVVGLGNSAMEMIAEFLDMQNRGIPVHPKILTHLGRRALSEPSQVVLNSRGELEGPVFRHPSNLTKIAGDMPRIRERYEAALEKGWVIPDVRDWQVVFDDPQRRTGMHLKILVAETDGMRTYRIDDVPMIYALIGYQNDADQLRRWGCDVNDDGTLRYDPITHRVHTTLGDNGGMYVLGAAASTETNRNAEVIPGVVRDMGELTFTEIIRANRRAQPHCITSERIPLDVGLPPAIQVAMINQLEHLKENEVPDAANTISSAGILRHLNETQRSARRLLSLAGDSPVGANSRIRLMTIKDMPEVLRNEEHAFDMPWNKQVFVSSLQRSDVIGMVNARPATNAEIATAAYYRWLERGVPHVTEARRHQDWLEAKRELSNGFAEGHMVYKRDSDSVDVLDFAAPNRAVAEALILKLLEKFGERHTLAEHIEEEHRPRYTLLAQHLDRFITGHDADTKAESLSAIEKILEKLPDSRLKHEVVSWWRTTRSDDTGSLMALRQTVGALSDAFGSQKDLEHEGSSGRVFGEPEIVIVQNNNEIRALVGAATIGLLNFSRHPEGSFTLKHLELEEDVRDVGIGTEIAAAFVHESHIAFMTGGIETLV